MSGKPRRYSAPGREAQARRTRARIVAAAHESFARHGFAATIREVAEAAQVSPATVELVFGTKAALLDAVVDVALAGDDEPVPVLERGWVHAALGETSQRAALATKADSVVVLISTEGAV